MYISKKVKIVFLSIIGVILAVVIGICIANACIPKLSDEEIKALLIESLEPQLLKTSQELGVSDLSIDFDMRVTRYKKPSLFDDGLLFVEFGNQYLSSKEFKELDDELFNEDTCNKYSDVFIDFWDVEIDNYTVVVSRDSDKCSTLFYDSDGDEYEAHYSYITKNGEKVYQYEAPASTSSKNKKTKKYGKCTICNGTGRVMYYAGLYDAGQVGICTSCNGKGKDWDWV